MSSSSPLVVHNDKEFLYTENSIPFACVNENACAGELESVSLQSSSSKRKARHFILTKFVLDRVAELTPRNMKLYNMIQTRENALCELRKMYRAKKLKEVCQLDSNSHTASFIFECRYFKFIGIY